MKLILKFGILHLLFVSVLSFNTKEGQELLDSAVKAHCNLNSEVTFDRACLVKLTQAYFNYFNLCSNSFASCEICRNQSNYIDNNILNQTTSYSINNFPVIGLKLALSVADSQIACKSNISFEEEANKLAASKSLAAGFAETLFNMQLQQLKTYQFSKCISYGELASESRPTSTTDYSKDVAAFLVLHQFNGFLLSSNCKTQPPYDLVIRSLYEFMGLKSTNDLVKEENLDKLLTALKIGKNVSQGSTPTDPHDHLVRKRRDASFHPLIRFKRQVTNKTLCILIDDIYGVTRLNHAAGMTYEQLKSVIPILLQQTLTNSCVANVSAITTQNPTIAQKYGYGSLSVFLITLCSVLGILVIPFGKRRIYDYVIVTFVGLGVGTLFGDAILHLIPQIMGQHVHDPKVVGKLIGILIAFFFMYLLECSFVLYHHRKDSSDSYDLEKKTKASEEQCIEQSNPDSSEKSLELDTINKAPITAGMMVIIGDAIHNAADGLAIGSAFAVSLSQGLAISIAVLCHELPHEFGDFAILLSSGFTWRKALIANILSGMTAFIGLYVGLSVSTSSELTQQIILAIAAGIFLYVALSDMIPTLKEYCENGKVGMFICGMCGMIFGFTVMALLSFFEESIKF